MNQTGNWIVRLLRAARQFSGRLAKITRSGPDDRLATLKFPDGGMSVHSESGGVIMNHSSTVDVFFDHLGPRATPATGYKEHPENRVLDSGEVQVDFPQPDGGVFDGP